MNESQLRDKVKRYLKTITGLWFWKVSDRYTSGIPDIVGCYKGLFFAIELKIKGNSVTKIQQYTIDKVKKCEGNAFVCHSLNEVKKCIAEIERNRV